MFQQVLSPIGYHAPAMRSLPALGLAAVAALGAAAPPAPPLQGPAAEFAAVCRRLTEGENRFFGRAQPDDVRRRLSAAGLDAASTATLQDRLARDLFRLGSTEEAITVLDRALDSDSAAALEAPLRSRLQALRALAELRAGEETNCVQRHSAESCIFPLAGGGLHALPERARRAAALYRRALAEEPGDPTARWLLNLAAMTAGDFPGGVPEALRLPPASLSSTSAFPRWPEVAGELGVASWDLAGGAVIEDFDGDGWLDLLTSSWDPCGPLKAFRADQRGGFEETTERWGLAGQLGGLNLVQADYDNDGAVDVLILRGAWLGADGRIRNSLLRNQLRAAGRFVDVTAAAGLAYPAYPTQAAAWADYDGDGDLDLYVGNENSDAAAFSSRSLDPRAIPSPSQLFRNDGRGSFTDVARQAGVANLRFAKGVAWGDYDGDGRPDLYVSNIGPNRLYRNRGDGTFEEVTAAAGVAEPSGASFATWFFDHDNDGDLDLFVADYSARVAAVFASYFGDVVADGHPVLYRNDGNGAFTDVSVAAGFERPLLPMGANYGDLDNDGWLDLYLGTGVPDFEGLMPNVMFRNDRGRRFEDITFAGGFGHLQKGHGVAFGDLDRDGDQDLLEQMGGAYPYDAFANALYENPGAPGSWIVLRLVGRRANRSAIGARLEATIEEEGVRRTVHLLVGSGGSFGASSLQAEMGLGRAALIESLRVRWPGSGTVQTFQDVAVGRAYELVEGDPLRPLAYSPARLATSRASSRP